MDVRDIQRDDRDGDGVVKTQVQRRYLLQHLKFPFSYQLVELEDKETLKNILINTG